MTVPNPAAVLHSTVPTDQRRSRPVETLLIALSGPSCSGKTTIARFLRDTLAPRAFILHEDDFYKTDSEVPVVRASDGRRLQDWDCAESLDLGALEDTVRHVKAYGEVRAGFESLQDQNADGYVEVDEESLSQWRRRFAEIYERRRDAGTDLQVVIIDGFLLFAESMAPLRDLFDVKILLQTPYALVKRRREARAGYVTQEGFWKDPDGYVDEVVWPNYVKDHGFLFRGGDVESEVDGTVCEELGIRMLDGRLAESEDMTAIFAWVAGVVANELEKTPRGHDP